MSLHILKIASLYAACSPEMGLVSYGACQDEALNNLSDEIAEHQSREEVKLALNALGKNEVN